MMVLLLVIFVMLLLPLLLCDVHAPLLKSLVIPSHDALLTHAS
jgi:hypothetical protein